ncbi:MAG: glycosyltransferase family 2 protein [Deltaproteobacteria bacterium]|nr:glycosyltransferase family 2 protein [Deltaproteobacteria bacterium]
MDISIIIVNWNTERLLVDCLDSIFKTLKSISFEVWVVDNGSADGSVEAVKSRYPFINLIENRSNCGFAAANNQALRQTKGRYALLLNTDALVTDGAIERLYDFMESAPDVGIACGQLLNPDGSRQNSFANFPTLIGLLSNETLMRTLFPKRFPSKSRQYTNPITIESCIGACMIVRKRAIEEVGLLDEGYFFFFEETDWAWRMRRHGWKSSFVPDALIFHGQGKSVGSSAAARIMFYRSRYRYLKKWHQRSYPLMTVIIFMRLLVNALLNMAGVLVTFGMHTGVRKKLETYAGLILWHLKGCP